MESILKMLEPCPKPCKIGKLPAEVRDFVDSGLRANIPYTRIIAVVPSLNYSNLTSHRYHIGAWRTMTPKHAEIVRQQEKRAVQRASRLAMEAQFGK